MNYLAVLSKEDIELAQEEIKRLFHTSTQLDEFICLFSTNNPELAQRLTYTNHVLEVKEKKSIDKWQFFLPNTNITKVIKNKQNKQVSSIEIKKYYNGQENMIAVCSKNFCYTGKLIWENNKAYHQRLPQLKPEHHPSSIKPKLARLAINLSGIQQGTVHDPLCGVGGILIESALMGLDTIGSDIDHIMLKKANINLAHYKAKAKLQHEDATSTTISSDAIITDVPYGKTTKIQEPLNQLYKNLLNNAKKITKTMVIIFPSTIDSKKIIKRSQWSIAYHHSFFVHKSLNKELYVLE